MKPTEAAALLTICAAYDNRKPDADAAKAWSMALDGLRFEDCREAVVNHYQVSREWIMPADVIGGVKRIRNQRVRDFGPLPAPDHLDRDAEDFDEQYQRYMVETTKAIADGTYAHPADVRPGALTSRDVIKELGQVKSVDSALATRPLREAHEQALRELQEAEAEKKRARDERQAELEAMRAAERAARADLTTHPDPRALGDRPTSEEML